MIEVNALALSIVLAGSIGFGYIIRALMDGTKSADYLEQAIEAYNAADKYRQESYQILQDAREKLDEASENLESARRLKEKAIADG